MNRLFTLLLAASCLTAVGQYQVGDVGPAGGWIFYVDTEEQFEEWDYLEVWPHTFSFFQLLACDYSPYLSSSEMGTGKNNTTVFASNNGTFSAFDFAVLFDGGGRSDWFLPSKSELEAISASTVSALINSGQGYSAASSSVFNECQWWTYDSNNGWGIQNDLYSWLWVLPIRSFQTADEGSVCDWQPDGNGDNLIGVNDLLDLLGVYGDTDYDQDGIWDSADDCVGEYDECGVCNGSGPSIPIIESIEILYDSVYAEPIDEWFVFEVGADTTFSYTCFEWQCGDPLEYQGYDYETVQIGERCWFQEHLKSSSYLNGEEIPPFNGEHGGEGFVNLEGSWFYQWASAINPGGLCPQGWSVPNVMEYSTLLQDNGYEPMLYPDHPYASLLVGYVDSDVPIESPWIGLAGTNEYSWTSDMAGIAFRQTSSTAVLEGTLTGNAFTIRCIKDAE